MPSLRLTLREQTRVLDEFIVHLPAALQVLLGQGLVWHTSVWQLDRPMVQVVVPDVHLAQLGCGLDWVPPGEADPLPQTKQLTPPLPGAHTGTVQAAAEVEPVAVVDLLVRQAWQVGKGCVRLPPVEKVPLAQVVVQFAPALPAAHTGTEQAALVVLPVVVVVLAAGH